MDSTKLQDTDLMETVAISYAFFPYDCCSIGACFSGSQPTCITGVINWVHGQYALNPNGSITLTPFGDGYQQIQDPCAAVSNFIENYNLTEYFVQWRIFMDATAGPKLHMFQFDGSPLAPQFQVSVTPNMLPTQLLRNVTGTVSGSG
jgi:Chaperone for protein-folding within the ER, fungal